MYMLTLRSCRVVGWLFVLLVFLSSLLIFFLSSSQPPPVVTQSLSTPQSRQRAAYNRLVSLPLSDSLSLAYGPLSLHSRSSCHPFLFPRPSSSLFITSWPNHGAGLGHQFGEWLYGPALAHMLGLTYVHTPFLGNSARWADWLGFGAGEDGEADVRNMATRARLVVRRDEEHYNRSNSLTVEEWVQLQQAQHQRILNASQSDLLTPFLLLPAGQDPVIVATLLRVYRIHVPHPSRHYSCHPDVNLLLRQKYCAARIDNPVREQLYAEHRSQGKLIVAFHLRCGDSCYSPFRTTSFPSVAATIRLMHDTLTGAGLQEPVFHLFSQPPLNNTAERHFAPLFAHPNLTGISLTGHWYTHAHTTLHHLITADVLIGAQSSFSWVASLLHHTVAMGPVETCRWQVADYDKQSGSFSTLSLLRELNASRRFTPQFDSLEDCFKLRKWTDELREGEKGWNVIGT